MTLIQTTSDSEELRADSGIKRSRSINATALKNGNKNRLFAEDRAIHDWYRFILSYPPQLVRLYIDRFGLDSKTRVLDPFCGTGTTLVECKKHGIPSLGLEAHPMAAFASRVKTSWDVGPSNLVRFAKRVAVRVTSEMEEHSGPLLTLPPETDKLLIKNSISPIPLHKTLLLTRALNRCSQSPYHPSCSLALASALVREISNLHFGPEVGVRGSKDDAPVVETWLDYVSRMAIDLRDVSKCERATSRVWCHDSRTMLAKLPPASVSSVITSPPYPNEKDYTRTTRLETVLLGLIKDRKDLRSLKQNLLRSNTRNVYKADQDHLWIRDFPEILRIAEKIEARRIDLGKTSGFERQYARVTTLYFGGMARHFADLRRVLRPGARLAYVVGDQASFFRIMIRTGKLLGKIAESLGYELEGLDLFRTRLATATREQLREEVLLLRWPG